MATALRLGCSRPAWQNGAMNSHPTLIVRARLAPELMVEFEAWHDATHLPNVLAIPGVVGARRVRGASQIPGTHQMEIEFEDGASVEAALASEEARRARNDWTQWTARLQELSIEIYAPLSPMPRYHHWN